MLNETQMGALRVLEALDDGDDVTAYTVNISNPVCPCCGAKLIIQDDVKPGQNEELNTDAVLDENYADPSVIIPLVQEAAYDIVEGYNRYADEQNLDYRAKAVSLCYPKDPQLMDAINRKAKELKSMFASAYGLLVNEQIVIQDLRDCIKKIVTGGRRS